MPRLNLPPLTRALLASVVSCTLLNLAVRPHASLRNTAMQRSEGVVFLTIRPAHALVYPWVFAVATLVEHNLLGLATSGLALFYGGRYLERAWGSQPFARFLLLVTVVPNLVTWLLYLAAAAVVRRPALLRTTISGGIALQAAFLVAFKQLVPEHTVAIAKGLVRMRVKHFPALFLASNTLSGLLLGTKTAMFQAYAGFFAAWIYLRFYRRSPSLSTDTATTGDGTLVRGDASDTFAFAHFFPEPLHTPVAALADALYAALVALGVCVPFSDTDIDAGNEQANARAEGGLPSIMNPHARGTRGAGGTRAEAERRRALALKALDQRLHAAAARTPAPTAPLPAALTTTAPSNTLGETSYEPESTAAL